MKIPRIEISVKLKGALYCELKKINTSQDCEQLLRLLFNENIIEFTEEVILICLNRNNKVIGWYKLSSGGLSGTVCDAKVIFTIALNCASSGIILAHNHPSGSVAPSAQDIRLTEDIKAFGKLIQMKFYDHLILSAEDYYSFADNGLMQ